MSSEYIDEKSNEHYVIDVDRLIVLVQSWHDIYNVA